MRISKMVLNFALMASVASIAATATAGSSCNMRSGVPRVGSSNPKEKHVSARAATNPNAGSKKSHAGKK